MAKHTKQSLTQKKLFQTIDFDTMLKAPYFRGFSFLRPPPYVRFWIVMLLKV